MKDHVHSMLNDGIDSARLVASAQNFSKSSKNSIGYPTNQDWDYSELFPFLQYSLNNVGNPFQDPIYKLNTLEYEREVIDTFAHLTNAPQDDYWGYVTSGGTEGNMYGLFLARETYPTGMVYFSEATHYSVAKVLRLQNTPSIMLRSQQNGEMDYADLRASLMINRHLPPIIFANIGTTMTGAIDNITTIKSILSELSIKDYYIHSDAALLGLSLTVLDNPPAWDFAAGIDSLSISGHKMLGSPVPCGITIAKKSHVNRIARSVEYVGVQDTTIAGSRSSFAPLILWYALRKHGIAGLKDISKKSIELAQYTVEQLNKRKILAWRNENSPIVVFPRPDNALIEKWSLAPNQRIAHIVCMPHMTKEIIDQFASDFTTP